MEQLGWQEKVNKSEHPSQLGGHPIKEEEHNDDFHGEDLIMQNNNLRMALKPKTTFGVCLGVVCVVILHEERTTTMFFERVGRVSATKTTSGRRRCPERILEYFWNLIYRHHVQPRDKLYVPNERGHFPIPLKYIGVVRRTNITLDVLLESLEKGRLER